MKILAFFLAAVVCGDAAETLTVTTPGYPADRSADYTTSHVFVDEVAGTSVPIGFRFTTDVPEVIDVELWTNLNRRDLARTDKNGDGVADGIVPVDGTTVTDSPTDTDRETGHYFAPLNMEENGGAWELTVPVTTTGAYRVTARFRTADEPGVWKWYGLRDHCVVAAPVDSREIRLYEINVFNIEASGDTFATRSTIEDLHNAPGAPHNSDNRWDLDYLVNLGCNWLWFQPIHPNGIDGREPVGGYGSGTPPYEPGSPYAVKNFFEVNPLMSASYDGSRSVAENRAAAMAAWRDFVAAADGKKVGIMLDAPFNHTAFDIELADVGVALFQPDGADWNPLDEIRNREARFFSKAGNYGNRASSAADIAAGPDRFDFGKWNDVKDVYFGRYDALVEFDDGGAERSSFNNEGDWFDYSHPAWTATDFIQGGQGRNVTHRVWDYFAENALHWLERTRPDGANRNSTPADGNTAERYAWDAAGIDGLRCDFGQGLPPRAWEYIINVARSKKWNFAMMAESLDGGPVTYRSARHFEILNESIVFPLQSATTKWDYRGIFEGRRGAYGQAAVLLNTTSHDEENYVDPWQALVRNSVAATIDGVTMVFPGQELGISRTFGYQHYEENFGKQIAHFKRWNSMMPAWNDGSYGNDQLYKVYAAMLQARDRSAALASSERWFLDGQGGNPMIHAVAKYEEAGRSAAFQDVVLAFANLDRDNVQADTFRIPVELSARLGLNSGRHYNVRNLAAYENAAIGLTARDETWLWPDGGYTGAQLEDAGFFVSLTKVPTSGTSDADPGGWATAPFEPQFLKLSDVTPPASPVATGGNYQVGDELAFSWSGPADPDDHVTRYVVEVLDAGGQVVGGGEVTDGSGTYVFAGGEPGARYSARLTAVSAAGISGSPVVSAAVLLLAAADDEDGDGQSNGAEVVAATDALDSASVLRIESARQAGDEVRIGFRSVAGVRYQLQWNESLSGEWQDVGVVIEAVGTTTTAVGGMAGARRFFRLRVVP